MGVSNCTKELFNLLSTGEQRMPRKADVNLRPESHFTCEIWATWTCKWMINTGVIHNSSYLYLSKENRFITVTFQNAQSVTIHMRKRYSFNLGMSWLMQPCILRKNIYLFMIHYSFTKKISVLKGWIFPHFFY